LRRARLAGVAFAVGVVVGVSSKVEAQPSSQTVRAMDVIVDHDGDADDLIAITLLMKSPAVRIRAITVCPGNAHLEPATRASQRFLDRLGGQNITIAQGHSPGTNPFPEAWRQSADSLADLPALAGATPKAPNPIVKDDAAHHLVSLLSGTQKYTILETGPLTNIADALELRPSIKNNITHIYVMGGAVRVKGNVEQPGHDGSAEWNFFNEPRAAAAVVASGIPITLVALDATNKVPLNRDFIGRLKKQPSIASRLASQAWELVADLIDSSQYFFWDTLTAAALIDPGIVRTEDLRIRVITTGASQGRAIEASDGALIQVAVNADRARVEQLFLDRLR